MRRHEGRGISPRPTPSLGVPTASRNDQVGIAVIRATHVHDRLDSTHGALHHGCYLCVWERVTAYSLPTGRRRPSRDLICYLQNLSFRQAKLDAWGHGPLQCRREPRLAAWAPCAGNASTPSCAVLIECPAKETHSKTCGPIGCKEAVRAEIAPARRKAPREGNIARAVPRACLGLAKSVLRPAPRLMRYARKEPPRCTNLLNVREYSAD